MAVQILQNNLGPDPAQELAKVTGEWTIRFLLLALALTPLRHLTGITQFVHNPEWYQHSLSRGGLRTAKRCLTKGKPRHEPCKKPLTYPRQS